MNTTLLCGWGSTLDLCPPADGASTGSTAHGDAIAEIQRFRGRVYREERAIPEGALDATGRFVSAADAEDWQVVLRGPDSSIRGCFRFALHGQGFDRGRLRAGEYLSRMPPGMAADYGAAIEQFIVRAQSEGVGFSEVGGWAVDREHRHRRDSILLPLSAWPLREILGHGLAIAFATDRNHSATILRRLGGFDLLLDGRPLPEFFDPLYGCPLHLLGFDSRRPSAAYAPAVAALKAQLEDCWPGRAARPTLGLPRRFPLRRAAPGPADFALDSTA